MHDIVKSLLLLDVLFFIASQQCAASVLGLPKSDRIRSGHRSQSEKCDSEEISGLFHFWAVSGHLEQLGVPQKKVVCHSMLLHFLSYNFM